MKRFLLLIFLFTGSKSFCQSLTAKDLFNKTIAAVKNARCYSFVLDMQERIRGTYRYNEYIVKINASPYKMYSYSVNPNPGAECLYVTGENNGKAYVNPGRFPFINFSMSPQNSLLRKNHQYQITQMGFNYICSVLQNFVKKYDGSFYDNLKIETDTFSKGKTYFRLMIEQKNFQFIDYKVQKGETMTSIADKFFINDFMILEANSKYKRYDEVKAGDIIKIPNTFGKKMELYIDKTTFLPFVQIIYDDKGLFSRIEFSSFVLNPNFTEMDFSKNNKKYGF